MPRARLAKRLLPFYVAVFLQGFILWYAVEKLFMHRIGFDDAGIGFMVAFYSAIMLLVETPSGVLADRWSRRGVLVVASVLLAASSVVGGVSHGVPLYLVAAALWGIFFALYSGAYDSILYDTLLEEVGGGEAYGRYYGYVKVVDSVALVLGSLLGGWISSKFGIREAFFWTVPVALAAIGALALFQEPVLHKASAHLSVRQQVRTTFRAVGQKGQLRLVLAVLVVMSATSYTLYEFGQLWWIALAFPVLAFGPANAVLLSTIGVGGAAAAKLNMHRYVPMQCTVLAMVAAALGLVVWRNGVGNVVLQSVIGVGTIGLCVVFNKFLHDSLPSQVRAGASSAVSSLTRIVMIPFSLLFGFVSRQLDVFRATWLFVVPLLVAVVLIYKLFGGRHELEPVDAADEATTQVYQK
ncbi:MAG TPA: MFS transporter [Candidatus Saccharimonadales bacterium]|nr:MFS transporter [Candidatus Saccharimonadales bacterium]